MYLDLKTTAAVVGSFMLGAGAIRALHAQSKPPAFVVAEVDVKDKAGFEENFLKAARKDISDHGGKYLAGGYNKTMSLVGSEPPNRVVILQFANMDAVKAESPGLGRPGLNGQKAAMAFRAAMRRAINAGEEHAATLVSKKPGTRNPKVVLAW